MKKIVLMLAFVLVFAGVPALAQTTTTSTDAQVNEIKNLTEQIKVLQDQRRTKMSALITTLQQGNQGDAVKTLQMLLSLDSTIYPEGMVTGYFGPLTAKAVKKFQEKNGLEQVGNVGPRTAEKLRKLAEDNSLTAEDKDDNHDGKIEGKKLCAIIPPGHLIAPGFLKKEGEHIKIPDCQQLPPGIDKKIHDMEDGEDKDDNNQPNQNDTIAPVISALSVYEIGTTKAKISWTTNEIAKDKIWISTTNPVVTTGTPTREKNEYKNNHVFELESLIPNTTYYYIVSSTDVSGNISSSTQGSFSTLVADTAGPIISAIAVSNISQTSAQITWNTNEVANGKVYYGTVNPLILPSALTVSASALSTGHTFTLSNLTANTVYYYVLESVDASNNKTTATQGSFSTLQ